MKVLILSKYGNLGASSRLRFFQYIDRLESGNIDITISPLLGDSYLIKQYSNQPNLKEIVIGYFKRLKQLMSVGEYDIVWLEKELFTWAPSILEKLLSKAIPYIVDYDDAIFHNYDLHDISIIRALYKHKIDKVMRYSHTVVAGNEYLADRAHAAGAENVIIIPTVIDIARYSMSKDSNNIKPVIGWMGSPSTSHFVENIKQPLKQLIKEEAASVSIVGADSDIIGENSFQYSSWSEDTEVSLLQGMDIGIMPLDDSRFARGKCGYKLIQYMACGLPVVASPVGVNNEIVEHGVNGFLAKNDEEWLEALRTLSSDKKLREKMGRRSREKVEKKYSTQVTTPILEKILYEAARIPESYNKRSKKP